MADLFLDTLPVNAHATASDALWAELPLRTWMGNTFAGRVGASLLHTIGLPELVASSLAEYEAIALALARDAEALARLRTKTGDQSKLAAVVRQGADNALFGNGLHEDVGANPAWRAPNLGCA